MLICGDFPKASLSAGSLFLSFQGTSVPPSPFFFLRRGLKKGSDNFERVCESSLLYLLPANPPKKEWIFGFPLGAGISGSFSRDTWLPVSVHVPSSFLQSSLFFSPHLSLWEQFRVPLTASFCLFLSSSLVKKTAGFLFCWGESWVGDAFCRELFVCCVCLSSFNKFTEETLLGLLSAPPPPLGEDSGGRNHLNQMAFCQMLLLFKVWPGKVMHPHDSYVSSFQEGHQEESKIKLT